MTPLSTRALNRAMLDRQMLLRRSTITPIAAIEHLVGLQAQAPFPPYTGLWTRLAGFRPDDLARLLLDRSVVRTVLMRSTVHLVSAADSFALRPVLQPMLDRILNTQHGKKLQGLDFDQVAETARALVEQQPRGTAELGRLLAEQWPDHDPAALSNLARTVLPLVQIPPRAVWGQSGPPTVTTAHAWLKPGSVPALEPQDLIVRYLGAFGPASIADMQKWSGLTRLREIIEPLRPQLRAFRHQDGGPELFDLHDAPHPDPNTSAPIRFLPEFDNLLISYADSTRIIAAEYRPALYNINGVIRATILVDGFAHAVWKIATAKRAVTLEIEPFAPLNASTKAAIEAEGARLLTFTAEDSNTHDIHITAP